ncbi:MAG TPA: plasmid stabilization protein [Spirochaetia bacterium]|nr:MAG: hypothetical protein A2Y41_13305 [Spirochaetes bacterium GWB1_36_13]HCL57478.1 plasmid stabilization protein [Spirochaetia bacterium]
MNLKYDKTFYNDLKKIKDKSLKNQIISMIEGIKNSSHFGEIKNIKKMTGYSVYYRIKLGDYRIGIKLENPTTVVLVRFNHRKDIYRNFP